MKKLNKVLVISPHTDDAELSCGGTLFSLFEKGIELYYAVFSPCYESVPEGFPRDILKTEMRMAAKKIGVKTENIFEFEFPVRHFPQHRQSILEELVKLRKKINPDLVLIPSSYDLHQDHEIINKEGIRAFKNSCILGYEFPWNNIESKINFYYSLKEKDLRAKIDAINCYNSQNFRNYKDIEFFKGLARIRGVQANTKYAEGFEMIKWII